MDAKMLSDEDFAYEAESLQSADLSRLVSRLKGIRRTPSGDVRVLPYLEALLDDRRACLVSIPYTYGEVRWLAAYALAAERAAAGIAAPVRLERVAAPLDTEKVFAAEQAASHGEPGGLSKQGGVEGVLEVFDALRQRGDLPLYDVEFLPGKPFVDMRWKKVTPDLDAGPSMT